LRAIAANDRYDCVSLTSRTPPRASIIVYVNLRLSFAATMQRMTGASIVAVDLLGIAAESSFRPKLETGRIPKFSLLSSFCSPFFSPSTRIPLFPSYPKRSAGIGLLRFYVASFDNRCSRKVSALFFSPAPCIPYSRDEGCVPSFDRFEISSQAPRERALNESLCDAPMVLSLPIFPQVLSDARFYFRFARCIARDAARFYDGISSIPPT